MQRKALAEVRQKDLEKQQNQSIFFRLRHEKCPDKRYTKKLQHFDCWTHQLRKVLSTGPVRTYF